MIIPTEREKGTFRCGVLWVGGFLEVDGESPHEKDGGGEEDEGDAHVRPQQIRVGL
jgi:hypothetical protein